MIHEPHIFDTNAFGSPKNKAKKPPKMTFAPRNNNVWLERLEPDEITEGGIALPDKVGKTLLARVLDIGPGKEIPYAQRPACFDGNTIAYGARHDAISHLEIGDIVLFDIRKATPCEPHDDGRLCIVDADHILAVVRRSGDEAARS